MRALSLTEPWALLTVLGEKGWETRSWSTTYRGELAIHASKGFPGRAKQLCEEWEFSEALIKAGLAYYDQFDSLVIKRDALPLGAIVGVCELVVCEPTWRFDPLNHTIHERHLNLTAKERAFGNFKPKRFAFRLANPRRLASPIPCKGALKIWDVPLVIESEIRKELAIGPKTR